MAKEVAKKDDTDLMVGIDIAADAGGGMEGTDKESFAIPFLRVIQKTSPQVDEADPLYIEKAKAGMLINTVTNALYDGKKGITFLPCFFQRRFLQWAPRGAEGSSFKGELLPEDVAVKRDEGEITEIEGQLFMGNDPNKCDKVQDTRTHFGIVVEGESVCQVAFPLSSTQIKKSKQLMSILSEAKVKTKTGLVTPPTWMNAIKLTTVLESNDKGSWYGVRFEAGGFINDPSLYAIGKAFHESIAAGEAKANFAAASSDDESADNGKF